MKQLVLAVLVTGCGANTIVEADKNDTGSADGATTETDAPGDPFAKFYNVKSITTEGDFVVIRTTDLPDHKSPFYPEGNALYEPYNGSNPSFSTKIRLMGVESDPDLLAQDLTFRIPKNPKVNSTHSATGLGPIGIAINGVVIFNQYNGMRMLLDTLEFNNMDQYNGHPTPAPGLMYHYHLEPVFLTAKNGSDSLVGYLLDGFPVYGPKENGKTLTNADLDAYHGHTAPTADYPAGIYHYHCTAEAPYINGDGYYGTPGTVTR
jgi:hypothetical protein